jgi:hypothetical protein
LILITFYYLKSFLSSATLDKFPLTNPAYLRYNFSGTKEKISAKIKNPPQHSGRFFNLLSFQPFFYLFNLHFQLINSLQIRVSS